SFQAPHQPGQPGFKFTVAESCDRIKDEFQFLQAQYHSLKVEYDKLANEKTEMQRHYVMYYEMSYGLNIEMHKQASSRSDSFCQALIANQREEEEEEEGDGSRETCWRIELGEGQQPSSV
ncbi:Transducin-like enhancer protein 3, partial [Nibea albiflora]